MTTWLVLTRAVHFSACLLFFGVFAFDRFVAAGLFANGDIKAASYWKSRVKTFGVILPPVILLSGAVWFILVAATMSGLPFPQIMQSRILETVWNQTEFGTVWKLRLIFGVAGAAVAMLSVCRTPPFQNSLAWIQWSCGGLLLGSLAWAGHGQEDSPWHLLADILHLLAAGLWPAGLLPFALLLRKMRRNPAVTNWFSLAVLVRRFSALSLVAVTWLTLTGLVNGWFLVGSVANLFDKTYGRWLLVKIILFVFAVAIGAVNLLRLKPRLSGEGLLLPTAEAISGELQLNVQMELVFGIAIIMVVAVLGILPPANH